MKTPSAPDTRKPRKLRVLLVDHTAQLSGGELAMLEFVRELDKDLVECEVILGSHGPLEKELAVYAPVEILPMSGTLLDTRKDTLSEASMGLVRKALLSIPYIFELRRQILARNIDVVHTNSLKADILGGIAALLAGVPLVWHVRDRIAPDYLPRKAVLLFRFAARRLPDGILGCSQAVIDTLQLPPSIPRAVCYSGVRIQDYSDGPPTLENSVLVHDSAKPLLIGLVGRLAPWKGQHIFLEAAAKVYSAFPNTRFLLYGSSMFGETDYEASLHELVARLGLQEVVEFKGFVRDIAAAFKSLDIVVHASTSAEPFGQTIVQGMASGKPVIATRGAGASEIIRDGVDGLLVDRGDVEQMSAAILSLLQNPELFQRLSMQGWHRVAGHFTIERTVNDLTAMLRLLANAACPPTRILFYNTTSKISGGEVVLLNILKAMRRDEYSMTVATPAGPLQDRVHDLGIRSIEIPDLQLRFSNNPIELIGFAFSLWNDAHALRAAIKRERPHIVQANSIRAGIVTGFASIGLPVKIQWHVHDNLPDRLQSSLVRITAFLSRKASFIAVSTSTADKFAGRSWLRNSIRKRTTVLLNGIDATKFTQNLTPQVRVQVRAELGIGDDCFCVLHIGQIAKRKNQLEAVRAFAQAFRDTPGPKLLIAGSPVFKGGPEYLNEIKATVHALGMDDRILFLGQRSDVAPLLSACDLLLLNSLNDPCPLTILEGMATSTPILATSVDGVAELLEDGESAWLVPPDDTPALANRLKTVLELDREARLSVGRTARAVVEQHSLENFVSQFYAITAASLEASEDAPENRASVLETSP